MKERSENCNRANEEENSKEQGRAEILRQGKRARIKRDQEREEEHKQWKQPQSESQQYLKQAYLSERKRKQFSLVSFQLV